MFKTERDLWHDFTQMAGGMFFGLIFGFLAGVFVATKSGDDISHYSPSRIERAFE